MKNSRRIKYLLKITFIIFSFGILLNCHNEEGEILESSKEADTISDTYINDGLDAINLNANSLRDLDIPTVTITKGLSFANPSATFRIRPLKNKDRGLELFYFKGQQFEDRWFFQKYYSDTYATTQDYVPVSIRRQIAVPWDDYYGQGGNLYSPLILKFKTTPNKTYRLKFKVENEQQKNRKIVVGIGTNLVYVNLNKQNEIIYAFESGKFHELEPIKIALGLFGYDERVTKWSKSLEITEIVIDEI